MRHLVANLAKILRKSIPLRATRSRLKFRVQPRLGVSPKTVSSSGRDANGLARLRKREAGKIPQLHQLGRLSILLGECIERLVDGQDQIVRRAAMQFVPAAAPPITIVFQALIGALLIYALSYLNSDVLGKVAELFERRSAAGDVSRETSATPRYMAGTAAPSAADSGDYSYIAPDPKMSERLRW